MSIQRKLQQDRERMAAMLDGQRRALARVQQQLTASLTTVQRNGLEALQAELEKFIGANAAKLVDIDQTIAGLIAKGKG